MPTGIISVWAKNASRVAQWVHTSLVSFASHVIVIASHAQASQTSARPAVLMAPSTSFSATLAWTRALVAWAKTLESASTVNSHALSAPLAPESVQNARKRTV